MAVIFFGLDEVLSWLIQLTHCTRNGRLYSAARYAHKAAKSQRFARDNKKALKTLVDEIFVALVCYISLPFYLRLSVYPLY